MTRRLLAAFVPLMLFVGSANALIVDDFVDPIGGVIEVVVGATIDDNFYAGSMIGGERDLRFDAITAGGVYTIAQNVAGSGVGSTGALSPGATWTALYQWDGVDGALPGLGAFAATDFTVGGTQSGLGVKITNDLPASAVMKIHTTGGTAVKGFLLPAVSTNVYNLNFGGGWAGPGTVDFTAVTGVELALTATAFAETDITIDWVRTTVVPEPGTMALLGGGLLMVARRRRRK